MVRKEESLPGVNLKSMSSKRHWKNQLTLSVTFFLIFTAFAAIRNIQNSLNPIRGTGLISLCLIYASLIVTALLSPFIIRAIGTKWTIVVGALCYCFYSYVNIFQSWYLIMAFSVAVGLVGSSLWVAENTYVTRTAYELAAILGQPEELVINRLHGLFNLIFSGSHISGNLILFFILSEPNAKEIVLDVSYCGAKNCGTSVGNSAHPTSRDAASLLFGVFTVLGMTAVLLATFGLDDQQVPKESSKGQAKDILSHLKNVFPVFIDIRMTLLTPFFEFAGLQFGFFYWDFTKAYLTCSQGISSVGLVLASFGASLGLCSMMFGQLAKITDRIYRLTFGFIVHLGLMAFLFFWQPIQDVQLPLFLVAVVWGMCASVWRSQVTSLVGTTFPQQQEVAFAVWNLFDCVGYFIGGLLSTRNNLCISHRLVILAGALIVSFCCYLIWELKVRKERRNVEFKTCPTTQTML